MVAQISVAEAASSLIKNERLRTQIAELAKKGYVDPGMLSDDEIWHVCRGMLSYLNGLLECGVPPGALS